MSLQPQFTIKACKTAKWYEGARLEESPAPAESNLRSCEKQKALGSCEKQPVLKFLLVNEIFQLKRVSAVWRNAHRFKLIGVWRICAQIETDNFGSRATSKCLEKVC